jgi:monoamine oxidase
MLKTLVNTLFCADPIEISLLQFVTLIRSHGSLNRLTAVKGGIQQHRFVGGAQEVANRMAARIGSALHLSSPVRAIAQDAAGVTVTADGTRVRARRAIVTVPPVLSTFIQFDPLMPPDRTLLMQRTLPSSARKIVLSMTSHSGANPVLLVSLLLLHLRSAQRSISVRSPGGPGCYAYLWSDRKG